MILFYVLCMAVPTACQEGHEAGDLLGQWRMDNSDTKYVKFSGSLVLFSDLTAGEVWGQFSMSGDSLFIKCQSLNAQASDTLLVENGFGFKPFDDIRLRVDSNNGEYIALSKDGRRWMLEKY